MSVDEKDLQIIEELRRDSRASTSEISRKTRIPRVTVHERIGKLKQAGVIRRFSAVLDYGKLGKPTTAFVLASYGPGHNLTQRAVAQKIAGIPGVYEVHLLAGEWDLLLKVRGESMDKIGELVIDRLRAIPGVEKTVTAACFNTVKEEQ